MPSREASSVSAGVKPFFDRMHPRHSLVVSECHAGFVKRLEETAAPAH